MQFLRLYCHSFKPRLYSPPWRREQKNTMQNVKCPPLPAPQFIREYRCDPETHPDD